MRKITFWLVLSVLIFQAIAQENSDMDVFISNLMSEMTLQEKIGQLNQVAPHGWVVTGSSVNEDIEKKVIAGQVGGMLNSMNPDMTRKIQELAITKSPSKIPIIFGLDVIHGFKTIFPIPFALSCSWNLNRIEQSARIAATEASASGFCWTFSPMVDISRDPRWGRVAEGAGEDPWWGAKVAEAMVKGYQGNDLSDERTILACIKHFAIYGAAEAGRDYNTIDMSRLSMYQDYFPPYKAGVEAGAGSVMTSFNVVDRIPATGNRWLMTNVLRDQWGFEGFVVTDYRANNEMSVHGLGDLKTISALSLNAGVDMDMVGEGFLTTLESSVSEGTVKIEDIDKACRRILEAKYKLGLFNDPYKYIDSIRMQNEVFSDSHLKAAREIAQQTVVLLKNDKNILPLKKQGRIALIGPLADSKSDMLGSWAGAGSRENVSTLKHGLETVGGANVTVAFAKGAEPTDDPFLLAASQNPWQRRRDGQTEEVKPSADSLLAEALEICRDADVIIASVGELASWSGEAASRTDITIPQTQRRLMKALKETGKRVVLVISSGRPLDLTWENENFDAIVMAWQGGTQGGLALADVLFGDYNPSAKTTMTFPRSVGQIPIYYSQLNTGRPANPFNKFSSKYIDSPNEPLFPFGYGLSYTTFEYGNVSLSDSLVRGDVTLTASVNVTNTGERAGEEVVQLYLADPVARVSRPLKELKGFEKVLLEPGETKTVSFTINTNDLKYYDSELNYDWDAGEFVFYIGPNSSDGKEARVMWEK
ncbi:MAG: beta-glucosidase BglX [Prolixibacteraceae bacterium]|nr:beta-glucosidase BglX [Prolixibacteraceae bacterium]